MMHLNLILHFVTFCILIKWRSTKKACHWYIVSLSIEVLLYCGLILRVWLPGTVSVRLLIHNFFFKVVTQFWCFIKMKASWCWFNSFISVKFSSWCHQFLGGSVHFSNKDSLHVFISSLQTCDVQTHLIDSLWFGNFKKQRVFLCQFCCSLCGHARVLYALVPCLLKWCDVYLPPSRGYVTE